MTAPLLDDDGDLVTCLDEHPDADGCEGPVEYRMALSGTGKSYPRCEKHWGLRLDKEDELRQRYPDSPMAPDWFDPTYAGEHWDSDY